MRKLVVLLAGIGILALVNFGIFRKEEVLANGRVVLLELAPVDPRSLMQGDYMALRFDLSRSLPLTEQLRDGYVVAALDEQGVARFRRLDTGTTLAADELKVVYRVREGDIKLSTNAFFFQEGEGTYYQGARYGEARVDGTGQMILTGLRDAKLQRLGPPTRR